MLTTPTVEAFLRQQVACMKMTTAATVTSRNLPSFSIFFFLAAACTLVVVERCMYTCSRLSSVFFFQGIQSVPFLPDVVSAVRIEQEMILDVELTDSVFILSAVSPLKMTEVICSVHFGEIRNVTIN